MISVTPATDSRSSVTRGFGQRPAVNASTRATSTAARITCTRGLFGDSRVRTSDSVNGNDWAPAPDGSRAIASTAQDTSARITPQNERELRQTTGEPVRSGQQ